jgi:hypothetical protein
MGFFGRKEAQKAQKFELRSLPRIARIDADKSPRRRISQEATEQTEGLPAFILKRRLRSLSYLL